MQSARKVACLLLDPCAQPRCSHHVVELTYAEFALLTDPETISVFRQLPSQASLDFLHLCSLSTTREMTSKHCVRSSLDPSDEWM